MRQNVAKGSNRRRWVGSVLVLVVAGFAVIGNAPAPGMRLVRTASSGANAPRVKMLHRTVRISLPPGSYKALAFWEYGRDQPALIIQARLPEVLALPHILTVGRRPPELKATAANFKVTVSPGSLGRVVDYGQQVGWFAVDHDVAPGVHVTPMGVDALAIVINGIAEGVQTTAHGDVEAGAHAQDLVEKLEHSLRPREFIIGDDVA